MVMNTLIDNLKRRNFDAVFFENKEEAVAALLTEFDENKSIAWGGSVTLADLGIKERLKTRNLKILDRDAVSSPEEKRMIQLASFDCDFYLMSSNAVTQDGKLVNIDGSGNRLACLIYGPRKVYVIVGRNKICATEEDAVKRVRNIAAPQNAKRLGLKTPCAERGTCQDCLSEQCICNQMVITRRSLIKGRIKVVVINEDLGY
jgi:hypothetical protein